MHVSDSQKQSKHGNNAEKAQFCRSSRRFVLLKAFCKVTHCAGGIRKEALVCSSSSFSAPISHAFVPILCLFYFSSSHRTTLQRRQETVTLESAIFRTISPFFLSTSRHIKCIKPENYQSPSQKRERPLGREPDGNGFLHWNVRGSVNLF